MALLKEKVFDISVGEQVDADTEQTTLATVALNGRPSHNIRAGGTQTIPTAGDQFGNDKVFEGARYGTSEFTVIMTPGAAAGDVPGFGPFIKAASFSETVQASTDVTYAAALTGAPVLTVAGHHDTNRFKYIAAAVSRLMLEYRVNQMPQMPISIISQNVDIDEHATPAQAAYAVPKAVQNGETVVTIDGVEYCFDECVWDFGIQTTTPGDLVCDEPPEVMDMVSTVTIGIKDKGVVAKKWEDIYAGDAVAVSSVHGTAGGKRDTVATSQAQLVNIDRNKVINGRVGIGLTFNLMKGHVPTYVRD